VKRKHCKLRGGGYYWREKVFCTSKKEKEGLKGNNLSEYAILPERNRDHVWRKTSERSQEGGGFGSKNVT